MTRYRQGSVQHRHRAFSVPARRRSCATCLQNAKGRRLAVIVNEFGDVGIDGEILKGCGVETCPEDRIVELSNGCICCTVADDFVPALESLLGLANPPEHIIIETSGLALPKPLVQAFNWPAIASRVTVDGVIAVVDGAAVAAGPLCRRPGGAGEAEGGGQLARSRQSAGGGLRGPASVRRPDRAQQGRLLMSEAERRDVTGRDQGRRAARGQSRGDRRRAHRHRRCCSASARGGKRSRRAALAS